MNEAGDTPHQIVELLAAIPDQDSAERWTLIRALQQRADRPALAAALEAAASPDPLRAAAGVDVLAQFGVTADSGGPFRGERLAAVLAVADRAGSGGGEASAGLLASALIALGHLKDGKAQLPLLRSLSHSDPWVRYAVAFALPLVTDAADPAPDVVAALVTLTTDADDEVRNWAVFGLGRLLDADTSQIRTALAARLDDPDPGTAEEALLGLAKRCDPGALERLRVRLEGVPSNMAAELADLMERGGEFDGVDSVLQRD